MYVHYLWWNIFGSRVLRPINIEAGKTFPFSHSLHSSSTSIFYNFSFLLLFNEKWKLCIYIFRTQIQVLFDLWLRETKLHNFQIFRVFFSLPAKTVIFKSNKGEKKTFFPPFENSSKKCWEIDSITYINLMERDLRGDFPINNGKVFADKW